MSFQSLLPSNLCPLMSHPDLCPFKNISPQICVLWCHTQIYVLENICSFRSVSSDVILRSRYYVKRNIPTDLCPPHVGQRGKKTVIAINSRIHIWKTYWLVLVWYQLISCIIYPFMLCVFCFLAISDFTAVCTILCTRPRIDIWIYFILIALILII